MSYWQKFGVVIKENLAGEKYATGSFSIILSSCNESNET